MSLRPPRSRNLALVRTSALVSNLESLLTPVVAIRPWQGQLDAIDSCLAVLNPTFVTNS
jgi:hypothetical protein